MANQISTWNQSESDRFHSVPLDTCGAQKSTATIQIVSTLLSPTRSAQNPQPQGRVLCVWVVEGEGR